MVATHTFSLIVATGWTGLLAVVLVGRSFVSWRRFRRAARLAAYSQRLADITRSRPGSLPVGQPSGQVIPLRRRTQDPAESKAGA